MVEHNTKYRKQMNKTNKCNHIKTIISLTRGSLDQKLSYRRGTARRAMLVNSCYVSQAMGVIKVSNSKSDLQGHWRWCHSI